MLELRYLCRNSANWTVQ